MTELVTDTEEPLEYEELPEYEEDLEEEENVTHFRITNSSAELGSLTICMDGKTCHFQSSDESVSQAPTSRVITMLYRTIHALKKARKKDRAAHRSPPQDLPKVFDGQPENV